MKLTLIRKKEEVPSVESFIFSSAEPVTWQAGQFLHCILEHEPMDNRGEERWFTIASAPFEKELMITTRIANEKGSSFKTALSALQVGETIEVPEIDGDFIVEDPAQTYVFYRGRYWYHAVSLDTQRSRSRRYKTQGNVAVWQSRQRHSVSRSVARFC